MKPNRSILISGPSRTGKTTTAELLAARYGIDKVKIGEKFRELTGIDTSKFVDRPEELDRQIDEMQSELIRNATVQAPFILEARLAAFLASKERQLKPDLPIVTVLFWAPEHVRMERQLRKVRREDPNTTVTLEDLRDREREREAGDLKLWRAVHPDLDDKNVFDPALTDERGKPVYDFVVDTRLGMPDTCADAVHRYLLKIGAFGG
ncbi:MAG: CMP/dCMP kinase [Chloroflexota bacterium]|jgi:cytidylate kinase|nr:CMP/dCMP kinase [Chloroflexota bacterium]